MTDTREGLLQQAITREAYERLRNYYETARWDAESDEDASAVDVYQRKIDQIDAALAALSTATPPVDGEAKMREALRRFVHAYSAAAGCIDFGLLREAYEQAREALSKNGELVC